MGNIAALGFVGIPCFLLAKCRLKVAAQSVTAKQSLPLGYVVTIPMGNSVGDTIRAFVWLMLHLIVWFPLSFVVFGGLDNLMSQIRMLVYVACCALCKRQFVMACELEFERRLYIFRASV